MSWKTSTWPSQPGPAPMPMVGIGNSRGDPGGQLGGHAFEHDGEGPRLGHGQRVGEQDVLGALDLVGPEPANRLRRQPDVAHHGDLRLDQGPDRRGHPPAPLELHAPEQFVSLRSVPPIGSPAAATPGSRGTAGRPRPAPCARPGPPSRRGRSTWSSVTRERGLPALDRRAHRVAHEQAVDPGRVEQPGGG